MKVIHCQSLTYLNDIFLAAPIDRISFHLFADDTCIFHSNKNYKKLDEIKTSLDSIYSKQTS